MERKKSIGLIGMTAISTVLLLGACSGAALPPMPARARRPPAGVRRMPRLTSQ